LRLSPGDVALYKRSGAGYHLFETAVRRLEVIFGKAARAHAVASFDFVCVADRLTCELARAR